jgi:death on curing protein
MIKTLKKHGNSMALVIEKPMMEALGITEKTPLQVTVNGNALVVTPANVGVGPERMKVVIKEIRKRYGPMLKRLADWPVKGFTFLSVDDVLLLHADTIDIDGGSHGVRDHGLLDAAVAMPRQQFGGEYLHEDIAAMSAAYLFHIAQNHPFIDGNKRAAVMSSLAFLRLNDVDLLMTPQELEETTRRVASGELDKEVLTQWMRVQIGKRR